MTDITDATVDHPRSAAPVPAERSVPPLSAGATEAPRGPAQSSERIDAIAAALARAQGQIANPAKGSVNPHFKSHYADLSAGLNAVRAALSANALAVVQTTRIDGDFLTLDTVLAHSSGQWMASQWPVLKLPAAPQVIGSALSYARRYSLFALVGIAGEDDDDANAATVDDPLIDDEDILYVETLVRDTDTDLAKFLAFIGAPSIMEMRASQFKRAIAALNAKKRKAAHP